MKRSFSRWHSGLVGVLWLPGPATCPSWSSVAVVCVCVTLDLILISIQEGMDWLSGDKEKRWLASIGLHQLTEGTLSPGFERNRILLTLLVEQRGLLHTTV